MGRGCILFAAIHACQSCKFLFYFVFLMMLNSGKSLPYSANDYLQIVGAFWYLLAIERNDTCWQKACSDIGCKENFLYCGNRHMEGYSAWNKTSEDIQSRCSADGDPAHFDYGIFGQVLSSGIISSKKFISKYCYCLWWGLQNLR